MVKDLNKTEVPTDIWAFLRAAQYLNKPSKKLSYKLAQRFGVTEEGFFVLIKLSKDNGTTCFN